MRMSGKFFKHGNTEIRNVKVDFENINIADLLIQNNTKLNGVVNEMWVW